MFVVSCDMFDFNILSVNILYTNVDEETLLDFERHDLKDLFDGNENFLLRRKLWKILEKTVRLF